jgi:LPPG:FO 2-phospho-L-lactate transferase
MRVTVLAGGVGAARMLAGLVPVVPEGELTAVVNTGDDTVLHGLTICPDLDTITYTLGRANDTERDWGLAGETWHALEALERFAAVRPAGSEAGATWFRLGDRDLATHLYRTHRLAEGATLTTVTDEVRRAYGVPVTLVPMSDAPAPTEVSIVGEGWVSFQTYFVGRRHGVPIDAVRFGADTHRGAGDPAIVNPAALAALDEADVIVIAPSNPIVSLGPLLAFPEIRARIEERRDDVVAVSPIVGGTALKGPADRMLVELGHEASVTGVARLYAPLAAALVMDEIDRGLAPAVELEGMRAVVTDTIMGNEERAIALARAVLGAVRP